VALVLLWEGASRAGIIPASILAPPSSVLHSLWTLIVSGELASNLVVSLARVAAGLAIGVTAGSVLALLAGLSRLGEGLVDPPVQMLRTLPILALTPLFIVWFGIGETPKVGLIALGVAFPIYLNLYAGIRGADAKLMEAGRTLGLSRAQLIAEVVLPGALPNFLVGLRYALSVSVLVLVVAESVNASAGLGYLINNARDYLRTDIIVVCLVLYAMLGLCADALVRQVERRALAWRPAFNPS
jgi:sulfonate transport system permease protein